MRGIDISHYQKGLDIGVLPTAGFDFAILKITEGSSHADETAPSFYMRARAAGIPVGGYCYSRALTPEAARPSASRRIASGSRLLSLPRTYGTMQ